MPAYVIGRVTISDPSWVEDYIPKVQALIEAHGGKYLVRSPEFETLEADGATPTVVVVLEFPDMKAARAWHESPEYKPFLETRQAGSKSEILLVEGL